MNNSSTSNDPINITVPPIIDLPYLRASFGISKTTAYALAASGEIQSLTMGAPGRRGKRVFLAQSVVEYVQRRLTESKPLNRPK